jgi:hypothetical protein
MAQERKHAEGCERELDQHKARLEDAYRKVSRLEAEVTSLSSAVEQKQDVIAALQVSYRGRQGCRSSLLLLY